MCRHWRGTQGPCGHRRGPKDGVLVTSPASGHTELGQVQPPPTTSMELLDSSASVSDAVKWGGWSRPPDVVSTGGAGPRAGHAESGGRGPRLPGRPHLPREAKVWVAASLGAAPCQLLGARERVRESTQSLAGGK